MIANDTPSSQELHYCLERLVALYRNLYELLREEYAHMGSIDLKGLAEVAQAKEAMLGEIWNLEQLRIQAADRLSMTLNLDPKSATLLTIASALGVADGEKLRTTRTALNLLVAQTKELNTKNMDFAESSLIRLEEMKKNVLGLSANASKENYSNNGVRQPMPEQGGRLLSTEA